jgi:carbohydrate kinase (thermoresistant glucokinase family)
MTVFVLMGVSGSGKSTVGRCVAERLALTFIEGDDFHPPSNVRKMAAGTPLTDDDRAPWIVALTKGINTREPRRDVVVACSALTQFVRERLRAAVAEPLHFILLSADPAIIQQRLSQRPQHFMKTGMLSSQLAALQWPDDATVIDASGSIDKVCADVQGALMETTQQQAILTIALLAAFVDGAKDEREREEIRRIAESLAGESGNAQLSTLYQDVLLKRVDLAKAAAALTDPAHKQLAYEMAVCVCDADGVASPAEQQFLRELREALRLHAGQATQVIREADAVAAAPLAAGSPATSSMSDAEMDKYILNHAIANGAIELLPQSLATMAIIPLQMKLVYRIGQSYGYEMDKGHIREFLATAGVGLTSQYVEQVGRKLIGGLLGVVAGGLGRGLGRAATGAAFSFATTYALGQVAKRYYAGGRQMNTALLQQTYQSLLAQAKQVQGQYAGEIQQKAQSLDAAQVMNMVKG